MMVLSRSRLDEMLEIAKWGDLAPSAVDEVAAALLASGIEPRDRYTALHIVARAGGPRFEDLLASHLDSPDDPMLARLALQALCSWLGLTSRYLEQVRAFVAWVPWDETTTFARSMCDRLRWEDHP